MKQGSAGARLRAAEGFEQFYAQRFASRWSALKQALLLPSAPIAWQTAGEPYYMDIASIMAALSLPHGGKNVLDMCAAPGGKSLVISSGMAKDGRLTANDRSKSRAARLVRTLDGCLAPDVRARVSVMCTDGARMCRAKKGADMPRFDRILLDAPCSSERHVIANSKYLSMWSPSRIKTLAMEQWALLSCAWHLLLPGGYLLYCTCALCHEENDDIIERLLHKDCGAEAVMPPCPEWEGMDAMRCVFAKAEQTQHGRLFLPDTAIGAGPLYYALVRKADDAAVYGGV